MFVRAHAVAHVRATASSVTGEHRATPRAIASSRSDASARSAADSAASEGTNRMTSSGDAPSARA